MFHLHPVAQNFPAVCNQYDCQSKLQPYLVAFFFFFKKRVNASLKQLQKHKKNNKWSHQSSSRQYTISNQANQNHWFWSVIKNHCCPKEHVGHRPHSPSHSSSLLTSWPQWCHWFWMPWTRFLVYLNPAMQLFPSFTVLALLHIKRSSDSSK